MIRIAISIASLFFAFTLSAQDKGKFKIYVFGSEYSGQTIHFLKDMENNMVLKERMTELDYSYIDTDTIDKKSSAMPYYELLRRTGGKQLPLFAITDISGNAYILGEGYSSHTDFLEIIAPEKLESAAILVTREDIEKNITPTKASRKVPFGTRLFSSPWGIGVEAGVNLSNLTGMEFHGGYKAGYYVNSFVKRRIGKRTDIQGGPAILSLRGRIAETSENFHLTYLSVPIDFETIVCRPSIAVGLGRSDLILAVGLYGSYLISDNIPNNIYPDMTRWDTGIRLRIVLQQGSFRLNAGYSRGLTDLFSGKTKTFTNIFTLGLSVTFGD